MNTKIQRSVTLSEEDWAWLDERGAALGLSGQVFLRTKVREMVSADSAKSRVRKANEMADAVTP